MSGLLAALRIARRDALRAKGRTALVMSMIGLPVLAIVMLAVLVNTADWSTAESLPSNLGRADARINDMGRGTSTQDVVGKYGNSSSEEEPTDTRTAEEVSREVTARLGPRARVLPVFRGDMVGVRTGRGVLKVVLDRVDAGDPMVRGMLNITKGRAPRTAGEVAVSAPLARRGFPIGSTIRIGRGEMAKQVVGLVRDPRVSNEPRVQGLPDVLPANETLTVRDWLVSAGHPVTWDDVRKLNQAGFIVQSRQLILHPPAETPGALESPADDVNPADLAVVAMVVAMIVLEVVLLAGPAFAVGLRRQRRQLALVVATGGRPRDLRRIVLGSGIVLGFAGALAGAALALVLSYALVPVIEDFAGSTAGPFEIPWVLVLLTMALGVASALAAALAPARQAARMDVVAALAGRRDPPRSARGWPIAGAVLIGVGLVLSVVGVRVMKEFGAAIGAVAIIAGFIAVGPWMVGRSGALAKGLPLPLRLAVRDGARNKGRTAPAVAAIMAAVAGVTALAIGGASDFAQRRVEYTPQIGMGSASIDLGATPPGKVAQVIERELPGVPTLVLSEIVDGGDNSLRLTTPSCQEVMHAGCPGVVGSFPYGYLIGGPEVARFLQEGDDPAVSAALRAGQAVVFSPGLVRDGRADVEIFRETSDPPDKPARTTIPAVQVQVRPGHAYPAALLPEVLARRLRLPARPAALVIDQTRHRVTRAEQDRMQERLTQSAEGAVIYVERGFDESFAIPLLLLAGVGSLMVLGGALIATGLSAADARPDLATLAAVGARPRTRRLLMMGQAAYVALLGCWLGIAAGFVPGLAVATPLTVSHGVQGQPEHGAIVEVPWMLLGGIGLLVPLVAVVGAGLFTRSRLPVVRRLAS